MHRCREPDAHAHHDARRRGREYGLPACTGAGRCPAVAGAIDAARSCKGARARSRPCAWHPARHRTHRIRSSRPSAAPVGAEATLVRKNTRLRADHAVIHGERCGAEPQVGLSQRQGPTLSYARTWRDERDATGRGRATTVLPNGGRRESPCRHARSRSSWLPRIGIHGRLPARPGEQRPVTGRPMGW